MIPFPFEGPRLKLTRARKHITDLNLILDAFFSRIELIYDHISTTEHRQNIWQIRFSESLPQEVPLLIGDVVHNLRSALDIMVCDIARLREKSTDKIKFPFAANADELEKILTGPKAAIKRLGKDVLGEIRQLHPHKAEGGNVGLRGLHDLDILDKHQLVIPTFLVAYQRLSIPGTDILSFMTQQIGFDFAAATMPVFEGQQRLTGEGLDPSAFTELVSVPIPTFPDGLPFAGHPVLETLESLTKLTHDILTSFESKFGGGNLDTPSAPSGNNHPVDGS